MRRRRIRSVVSAVAVCLSGWLGRALPGGGASVRRHVIDELNADAFLAATYDVGDCPFGGSECLMANVAGLRPFTAVSMERMISLDKLRTMVQRWPRFADVKVVYNFSWFGLTPFAPVLGKSKSEHIAAAARLFSCVPARRPRREAAQRYLSLRLDIRLDDTRSSGHDVAGAARAARAARPTSAVGASTVWRRC